MRPSSKALIDVTGALRVDPTVPTTTLQAQLLEQVSGTFFCDMKPRLSGEGGELRDALQILWLSSVFFSAFLFSSLRFQSKAQCGATVSLTVAGSFQT